MAHIKDIDKAIDALGINTDAMIVMGYGLWLILAVKVV